MFYDTFVKLCANKKVSPSRVAEEIGLTRTAANGWKNGKKPSDVSLRKIADYFDVPTDYLLGSKEQEKTPSVPVTEKEELISHLLAVLSTYSVEQLRVMVYMAETRRPE